MIYSMNDISKFYSKVVKENLEYGDINIPSMGGSQGEDSRIDINIGGGRIRRILIDSNYDSYIGDVTFIKVIDFMDNGSYIYWNDRGDLVQVFYFVPIKGSSNSKYYMANSSELALVIAKRKMRQEAEYRVTPETDIDSKYYPIFKRIVQSFNKPAWKRFDIKSVSTKVYPGIKYYMVEKVNGGIIILRRKGIKFYLG